MRTLRADVKEFQNRRRNLLSEHHGSAFVLFSGVQEVKSADTHFPFRVDSNFYYLTGLEEPESVLLLRPGMDPESVLFIRGKDPKKEQWEGFQFGVEESQSIFKVDQVFNISELDKELPQMLLEADLVYYPMFRYPTFEKKFSNWVQRALRLRGRSGLSLPRLGDVNEVLSSLRLVKTDFELSEMRRTCEISAKGHAAAMQFVKPGVNEREIEAVLSHYFMMNGAQAHAYDPIVGSGNNATVLHYTFNDQPCNDGDLLLIDAGAHYNYYSGDITRSFPVNGKFSDAQKDIYSAVLSIQKSVISEVKPGVPFLDLHQKTTDLVVDALLDLGLLSGRREDIIESRDYAAYYPHSMGHWLGIDVHDVGTYYHDRHLKEKRVLEPGMIFTIEPGLYFTQKETRVPEKYRGIGVRIEDNILVTPDGCEVFNDESAKRNQ